MKSNIAETIKKAMEDAGNKGIEKVAKKMIENNFPLETIADYTELPIEKILKIANG